MKTTAKRTQIYLPTDLHQQAFSYARGKRLSFAAVIRLSLQDFLVRNQQPSKRTYEKDPLWMLLGAARSRDGDLSTWHDHYLYGRPKTGP
jgi:hypothetical protein